MTVVKPSVSTIIGETPRGASFTLQQSDNGVRFVVVPPFPSAPITITLPDPGVLGNGFQCRVINDSGADVTIDGRGLTNVTMTDGDVARIFEANLKQRVVDESSTVIGDLAPPGPSWQPLVFGYDFDLVHWWDATTNVTLDPTSGLVSSWTDKVRNSVVTQTTAAQQPAWVNGDEVRFNGTGIGLQVNNQGRANYESKWWQMIFRVNWTAMAASSDTYFLAVNGTSDLIGQKQPQFRYLHATHQVATDWYSDGGLVSVTVDIPGADDTWHSLICRRTDTHIYASVDGAAEVSLACYPRAGFQGGTAFGYIGNMTGSQVTSIGIDSLLWGQREISTDEIAKAHAWAMWRRGAQAHLDASSPYLLAEPTMVTGDIHVADPDSYAGGYRFPVSGGWDDTVQGNALDLTGYTRTFHDHFTDIASITDVTDGVGPWYAPAHLGTSGARFQFPSPLGVPGTFTILPDNTTLQIKMSKLPAPDVHYASGHIQTADWWRNAGANGFTQSTPTGGSTYYEARMAFNAVGIDQLGNPVNPAPSWPAFWLYTILDDRDSAATKCELDVMECYGDNTTNGNKLHIAAHRHSAYRPQPGNAGSLGNEQTGGTSHTPSKVVNTSNAPFSGGATLFDGTGNGNPGTFHTYGLMIDETWLTWYFDGKIVSRFATFAEALGELYILVSFQSQDLTSPANCETYLWVDYVDAWSHA